MVSGFILSELKDLILRANNTILNTVKFLKSKTLEFSSFCKTSQNLAVNNKSEQLDYRHFLYH